MSRRNPNQKPPGVRPDDWQAWNEHQIMTTESGRWYLNGGEITAPVWSRRKGRNLLPPWWPVYTDRETGETHDFSPKP